MSMANKEHFAIIRQGVELWNKWSDAHLEIGPHHDDVYHSGANLRGANLRQAIIDWTMFGNVDLSEVKGLETIEHRGPSIIGIDTIYRSKGNISEAFLRGAGVPDNFITYMKSLTGVAFDFYS